MGILCFIDVGRCFVDKNIAIWRYKDPVRDTRKIPNFEDIFADKEELNKSDEFIIEDKSIIHVKSNGSKKLVGDSAVFVVTP